MTFASQFRGFNRSLAQHSGWYDFQTLGYLKVAISQGEPFALMPLAVEMPMKSAFETLVIAGKHKKNIQFAAIVGSQFHDALIGLSRPANFYEAIRRACKISPSAAPVSIVPIPGFALGALNWYDGRLPAVAAFVAIAQEHRNALYHGYSITKICYIITTFLLTDNVLMVQNYGMVNGGHMTVARNTKKAKQAIENAKNIRVFSLSNDFNGKPLSEKPVVPGGEVVSQSEFLSRELNSLHAKLTSNEIGKYTIHVHSNLWYEFEAA